MKIHYLALPLVLLSACAPMGSMVKESAMGLTERDGRNHFTFAGELPADFGIRVSARYYPLNPERCQTFSMGTGGYVVRDGYKQYETEFKSKPSRFSFDIPLSRHVGLCNMELGRVAFFMGGRYGERSWDKDGDHGVIAIAETRPEWAPTFDEQGTQRMRGYCTWLFQISKLRLELEKLLNCSRTDATWEQENDPYKRRSIGLTVGLDELPGKTVVLDMRVDPHERPATRETWIKFPEGWKPCAEEEVESGTWIWCRNPPTFRTFKMNGQECTVYPRCEE